VKIGVFEGGYQMGAGRRRYLSSPHRREVANIKDERR
jgi:hypothetical protein